MSNLQSTATSWAPEGEKDGRLLDHSPVTKPENRARMFLPPACRIALCMPAAQRLAGDPGVPGQGTDRGGTAVGQQRTGRGVFLGRVRQCVVPQLLQRPRPAGMPAVAPVNSAAAWR